MPPQIESKPGCLPAAPPSSKAISVARQMPDQVVNPELYDRRRSIDRPGRRASPQGFTVRFPHRLPYCCERDRRPQTGARSPPCLRGLADFAPNAATTRGSLFFHFEARGRAILRIVADHRHRSSIGGNGWADDANYLALAFDGALDRTVIDPREGKDALGIRARSECAISETRTLRTPGSEPQGPRPQVRTASLPWPRRVRPRLLAVVPAVVGRKSSKGRRNGLRIG